MTIISHVYPGGYKETKEVFNHPDQKFPIGTEVYIVPITETSMLHFECDVIAVVKYTYGQMFGDNTSCHKSYSTTAGTWYDEHQLVATNGRDINQCRQGSYEILMQKRKLLIDNDPLNKMIITDMSASLKLFADEIRSIMKNKESK